MTGIVNTAQAEAWNGYEGEHWAAHADRYDAVNSGFNEYLLVRAGPDDRVLDIGCGNGQLTRLAAARARFALGVDLSGPMLATARARAAGLPNVAFEQGDVQVHPFTESAFDLAVSRFGVMFFADPAAAFANIGRAMRPGGRLVWMVWQGQDRNEWSTAIRQALEPGTVPSAAAAPAFSLADPAAATGLLEASGFTSVDFAEVHEPVFYGVDVDAAYDALAGLQFIKEPLARADAQADARRQRLRDLLEAHLTPDGVLFDSRAWIITAYRANG